MIKLFKSLIKGKETTEEEKEKKNFEILKYDGIRAQRIGRIDYAAKCFAGALNIREDFEVLGLLSQIYIQQGEIEQAKELLNRMALLEPETVNTYLILANTCYMQEEYKEMAQAAQKAIELDNQNAIAFYLLAKANHGLKDNIGTIANLTKAIMLKEDFQDAYLMRAEDLLQMKQYKEALEDIEKVLHFHPEEEGALLLRGKLNEATGKPEEAENDYRTITELNPFNEQAYIALGQLYITQKKLTEAIELFDEAIELNPNAAAAYHERGRAKLLNGDKEGSIEDMKQALQLNPKENENFNGEFNNLKRGSDSVFGVDL